MKVGVITPGFSASEKDWCIPSLLNFIRLLSTRAEVEVFSLHYPHSRACYQVHGAQVHALAGRNARALKRLMLFIRALGGIRREHKKRRFDVLHSMWAGEPGMVATLAGKLLRVPVIVTANGGEVVGLPSIGYGLQLPVLSRFAVKFSLRLADRTTVASNYMYRLCKPFVSRAKTISILPFGVDIRLFRRPSNHTDQSVKRIVSVGSLIPVKAHSVLLHAVAKVSAVFPNLRLTIVGGGPLEDELRNLAEVLGISERVDFIGAVNHDELPSYYGQADVLALPSLHEAEAMVAVEALACGMPVVGSNVGILPDLPEDVCRTTRPGDSEALACGLLEILNDGARRESLSAHARILVEEKYTIEKTVESFLKLYKDVSSQ